jgi:hypothetical protein
MNDWMPPTAGEQFAEIAATLVAFIAPLILIFGPLLFCAANAATVTCRDSSGGGGKHWMWREIDGRRCWFEGDELRPKSELSWAVNPEQQIKERVRPAPLPPTPPDPPPPPVIEETQDESATRPIVPPLPPHILRVRIVHEGMANLSNWIDGKGRPIDLMQGNELWGARGVGGVLVIPPYYNRAARIFNELEK